MRAAVEDDEGSVRQRGKPRPPQPLAPALVETLVVQGRVHRVHIVGRAQEGGEKRLRRLAPTLEAGAVAGRERGRLVEKEELGVAGAPDLAPPALEGAEADDPAPRRPAAAPERPVGPMQAPAAVAQERAARRDRMEFAERIDAVLQRAGGDAGRCVGLRVHLPDSISLKSPPGRKS